MQPTDTDEDADKHGEEVRLVEPLHRVAELMRETLDVLGFSDHRKPVAELESEVGSRQQVYAGAGDTCHVQLVAHAEAQAAEFGSVVVCLRHKYLARNYRTLHHFPFLLYLRSDKPVEGLFVLNRAYDEHQISQLKHVFRLGDDDAAVGFSIRESTKLQVMIVCSLAMSSPAMSSLVTL